MADLGLKLNWTKVFGNFVGTCLFFTPFRGSALELIELTKKEKTFTGDPQQIKVVVS
jgi:hypothetical protein